MESIVWLAINILGGLGLFLYGLKVLSNSLQKVSSQKLKSFFDILTRNKLMGITFGAIITSILQSSSATTVIMVGFANAGIIKLAQCISIVFGANIGTTITAQIIAFKASSIALPLIGIGASLFLFSRNKRWQSIGEVILGLGILFFGLKQLGSFLKPLKDIPAFSHFLVQFGQLPLLGILAGTLVTIVLQSSSATTGMIITLASLGMIDFKSAFCLELGSNIGTTITAQIAAIGTNVTAKRTAWAHTLFNVLGSTYMLLLLYIPYKGHPIFLQLINSLTPGNVFVGENLARHCANAHTFFNIFNTVVLLPFIGVLAKATEVIVPERTTGIKRSVQFLDDRMTSTPPVAITQAIKEVHHMAKLAKEMNKYTYQLIFRNKVKVKNDIENLEDTLNTFQDRIVGFLIKVNRQLLSADEARASNAIIHLANRLERIGDHNMDIIEQFLQINNGKRKSDSAHYDSLFKVTKNIQKMYSLVITALNGDSSTLAHDLSALHDENIDIEHELRDHQIESVRKQTIEKSEGILLMDIFNHYERIGNHLTKIEKPVSKITSYKLS